MFLNLFIAIMIDAFFGQTDMAKMTVKEKTLEDFQKHWSKYDPEATGFISVHDLKHLFWDLANSQDGGGALILKKKLISQNNQHCYANIKEMGIPTYENMKKVMFHDVMIKLCYGAVRFYF